jgi:hypothetical protein
MEKRKYEIRKREDGREAIFDTETGERISGWWYSISYTGLVKNQSEYYQVMDAYDYCAIFHKDGRQISNWYEYVSTEGLVEGKSIYYIVGTGDDWFAIYDVYGRRITPQWFDYVWPEGLVEGQREIYIAQSGKRYPTFAIFDVNGNMITPKWFLGIMYKNLFFKDGEEYYIGIEKVGEEKLKWAIYHLSGKKVSKYYTYTIRNVEDLNFDTLTGTLEIRYKNGKTRKIDFEPIQPIREEIIDYTKLLNI